MTGKWFWGFNVFPIEQEALEFLGFRINEEAFRKPNETHKGKGGEQSSLEARIRIMENASQKHWELFKKIPFD